MAWVSSRLPLGQSYIALRLLFTDSFLMRTTRRLNFHMLPKKFGLACLLAGFLVWVLYGCVGPNGGSRSLFSPRTVIAPDSLPSPDAGQLMLLVPQGQALTSPLVTAWVDAASEIGVRMQVVTDPQFRAMGDAALQYAGLVLPDQLHPIADEALLKSIRSYVRAGGQTMLVYDFAAFALDSNQRPIYPIPKSRLSDLAGVDYALYDKLREKTTAIGPIAIMRSTMRELQVPPGKSSPYVTNRDAATSAVPADMAILGLGGMTPDSYRPESTSPLPVLGTVSNSVAAVTKTPTLPADGLDSYSGYLLGNLIYSSFVTQGGFKGTTLASSAEAGLVAGLHKVGRGQVMFVNLPLTYLKVARTDGLLMHGFLRFFAHNVLHMAQLSAVPDGVAGLTLNWHLDSFTAQLPTLKLEKLGVFNDGPFSINMTAGPDAVSVGDAKGWNLDNNPIAQRMLQRFVTKGHAIGSHGGWNHDYYGLNANDSNQSTFQPYLERNASAIRRAVSDPFRAYLALRSPTPEQLPPTLPQVQKLKLPVDLPLGPTLREYSPPVGNNPLWAMDWLEQQGVVAAYFAGHTGMGPTRHYRDGQLRNPGMWMFPVTPFGRYATFEEFQTAALSKQDAVDWYRSSVDFAIAQNTSRMIYMHPNGANVWPDVLLDLLAYAKTQGPQRFRWYTMTRLADFMTARLGVTWTEQRDKYGVSSFEVTNSSSLNEMVWMLPKARYADLPTSQDGSVTVSDQGADWAVRAGNTHRASFTALNQPMRR